MSSRSDPDRDEAYREDDRYDDPYTEDEGRGGLPFYPSWGWGGAWGIWPFGGRREEEARYDGERTYENADESPYDEDDNGSLWDEGLITLLILGGVILFLFPEPFTSGLGIVLIGVGVIAWLIDWAL